MVRGAAAVGRVGGCRARRLGPPLHPVWLQATILREHRGDGHVLAAVGQDLRGLDATITLVATGAVTRSILQHNRGWSDADWDASVARLRASGWLNDRGRPHPRRRGPAGDGGGRHRSAGPRTSSTKSGPDAIERIIDLAAPLARHLIDQGALPIPNPIGVPRALTPERWPTGSRAGRTVDAPGGRWSARGGTTRPACCPDGPAPAQCAPS